MKASRRSFLAALGLAPVVGRFLPKRWFAADGCPGTTYGVGGWTENLTLPKGATSIVYVDPVSYCMLDGQVWMARRGYFGPAEVGTNGRPTGRPKGAA